MTPVSDTQAAKRAVNLTMNGDLVEKARAKGLSLSALAEKAVAAELVRRAREQWDAEIAEACAAHERYLVGYGSASDLLRGHLEAEGGTMPPNSPRRYDIVRHRVGGMKAPYLIVLQHHDVPSITRIIAPLTLPQRGDHNGVAPLLDVGGISYRARLLDLAAYPCSVLLETVESAAPSSDAIVQGLDVIFGGCPVGLRH